MHREFEVHLLNPSGIAKAREIAAAFDQLLDTLDTICSASREYSIVKTKLEEASFFAKKSNGNTVGVPAVVINSKGRSPQGEIDYGIRNQR